MKFEIDRYSLRTWPEHGMDRRRAGERLWRPAASFLQLHVGDKDSGDFHFQAVWCKLLPKVNALGSVFFRDRARESKPGENRLDGCRLVRGQRLRDVEVAQVVVLVFPALRSRFTLR